mgnify:CR=1 FL=1
MHGLYGSIPAHLGSFSAAAIAEGLPRAVFGETHAVDIGLEEVHHIVSDVAAPVAAAVVAAGRFEVFPEARL